MRVASSYGAVGRHRPTPRNLSAYASIPTCWRISAAAAVAGRAVSMRCCERRRSFQRRGGRKRDERDVVERKTPPAAKPLPGRNPGGGVFEADEAFADRVGARHHRAAAADQ